MTQIDPFAEAEALVDGVGPRPPGSDAERRAARHLAERLGRLGREVVVEPFSIIFAEMLHFFRRRIWGA